MQTCRLADSRLYAGTHTRAEIPSDWRTGGKALCAANQKNSVRYVRQRTERLSKEADRCDRENGIYSVAWAGFRLYSAFFRSKKMLETIAILLIVLWVLGLVTSYTMGGFIHILIVIAVVVILLRVIQGRRL